MLNQFINPNNKVIKRLDKMGEIFKSLQALQQQDILVGIPEDETIRDHQKVTNAELAFLHSEGAKPPKWAVLKSYQDRFGNKPGKKKALKALDAYIHAKGSPYWNIPARPFLEPAMEANKVPIADMYGKIIKAALDGKAALMKMESQKLGLYSQRVVKDWFTDPRNGWAPNHPLIAKLKGSDKPLIDTGQLRNSITYVIRRKDAN